MCLPLQKGYKMPLQSDYYRIYTDAVLVVKFAVENNQTAFNEYRVSRGKKMEFLMSGFRSRNGFRFAVLYAYNRLSKVRGSQIAYFDNRVLKVYNRELIH